MQIVPYGHCFCGCGGEVSPGKRFCHGHGGSLPKICLIPRGTKERTQFLCSRWRSEHKEKTREYSRDYYRRNPEKVKAQVKRWRHANPEKVRAGAQRRRGAVTAETESYLRVLRADPCAYCGAPCQEIDHIVPSIDGGSNEWDNLTAACQACNRSKRTAPLLEFLLRAA